MPLIPSQAQRWPDGAMLPFFPNLDLAQCPQLCLESPMPCPELVPFLQLPHVPE